MSGYGVAVDYDKAKELYELAAVKNNEFALYHLGYMAEYGLGQAIDIDNAIRWYNKSCDAGNVESCEAAAHLLTDTIVTKMVGFITK